jgi:chromosomal replication initiator protein
MEKFWPICLSRFEQELSAQQFNTWIKPLQLEVSDNAIRLLAPNKFVQQWVKDRFLGKIETIAAELLPHNTQIELAISDKVVVKTPDPQKTAFQKPTKHTTSLLNGFDEAKAAADATSKNNTNRRIGERSSGLNPSFNFNNYVTGRANQLARAAAIQVAENPGQAYNPLFIYGGVGLGKTHLLQAIGNQLKQQNPEAKIRYLHAERYVSDVVKAYENKAFDDFKRQYHSLDLLLIDDIQFFAKKTRTQEEFFYAFNTLIEEKKQIVITCDTYPKEIIDVDERLRTRFSWGLTVAIEPPELEMRVAILLKKAEESKINLHEDAAFL